MVPRLERCCMRMGRLKKERKKRRNNGRENTSFSGQRVLDHLGLTPYLHSITLLIINYDGVNGCYYQIGVIKYNFLDYERYSNSLSSGC